MLIRAHAYSGLYGVQQAGMPAGMYDTAQADSGRYVQKKARLKFVAQEMMFKRNCARV